MIDVLERHGVEVSCENDMFILIKGDKIDARRIPAEVPRRVLQYFKRLFDVPVHHFYNPLMAPERISDKIQ